MSRDASPDEPGDPRTRHQTHDARDDGEPQIAPIDEYQEEEKRSQAAYQRHVWSCLCLESSSREERLEQTVKDWGREKVMNWQENSFASCLTQ